MNAQRFIVGLGIALSLAGSAGVWYWALYWPKPVAALDAKYCGTFELFRYEPPEGQGGDDPIARGQRWIYTIGEDHIYTIRVLVDGEYEMARRSGVVTTEPTPDGDHVLVLQQHTMNSIADLGEPDPYYVEWGTDENGAYMRLIGDLGDRRGQQLFLRPQQ